MNIHIYVEGGGDQTAQKALLRNGLDAFFKPLKDAARIKRHDWRLVPCGGRHQAWDAFLNANTEPGRINFLLVDSECPVEAGDDSCQHLAKNENWVDPKATTERIFLMIQCMETWLIADSVTLKSWYGQGFNGAALPKQINLETVPKQGLYSSLANATRQTQKGAYSKIKHASELLKQIDSQKVRQRCPEANRFFEVIETVLKTEE
jgi:hypothetical protein